mgnify:CR=1 FL=1
MRSTSGSSPRARGTLLSGAWRSAGVLDHPRVRGEHACLNRSATATRGSSPRARGTPLDALDLVHRVRIIPACAGNTAQAGRQRAPRADHPRVRGEHADPRCMRET